MHSAELAPVAPARHSRTRRFAVSWRNTTTNRIHPIGLLVASENGFQFRYLGSAATVEGFKPFIGFPRLEESYASKHLWPFFSLRAMDSRRPDFEDYVTRLGLDPAASVLDILSRSGGETAGDRVSVIEAPFVAVGGSTEYIFLARGTRYAIDDFNSAHTVDQLRRGDRLELRRDTGNPVNPNAMLIVTSAGSRVGWVPDMLVDYFRELSDRGVELTIARNNGPDTSWPLRLLLRARGSIDPNFQAFSGPAWVTTPS